MILKCVRVCLHRACMFRGQLAHTQVIWTHHMLLQLFKLKRMQSATLIARLLSLFMVAILSQEALFLTPEFISWGGQMGTGQKGTRKNAILHANCGNCVAIFEKLRNCDALAKLQCNR